MIWSDVGGIALLVVGAWYFYRRDRYENWMARISTPETARRNKIALAILVPVWMLLGLLLILSG